MKIETLKDIKEALKNIPDDILDRFGVDCNPESDTAPELLCVGKDDFDLQDETRIIRFYEKMEEEYPQIKDINKWIGAICNEAVNAHEQEDSVYERESFISSEEKK